MSDVKAERPVRLRPHAQFLNEAPAVVNFCVSDFFIKVVVILIAANSSDGVRNLIDAARGIAP
jgi:hypothetical protein